MRRLVGRVFVLTMISAGASSAMSACYADDGSVPSQKAGAAKAEVGSLGVNLHIGSGIVVDTASYTVTGPGSFMKTGSIDLGATEKLSVTIGGLPAGTGYSIAISATAIDGITTCGGSNGFDVMAHVTTSTTVALDCHEPPRKGSVLLTGVANICPVLESLDVFPNYAWIGRTATLTARAHDSDNGPSALTYEWSASAGMLDASGASATFTCTDMGVATITLTIADGDPSPTCADTMTTVVGCVPPDRDQ